MCGTDRSRIVGSRESCPLGREREERLVVKENSLVCATWAVLIPGGGVRLLRYVTLCISCKSRRDCTGHCGAGEMWREQSVFTGSQG